MKDREVLKAILFQLDRAQIAYQAYKKNSIYLYAKSIQIANMQIIEIINSNAGLFSGRLREVLLHLVSHLDIWFAQFQNLEMSLSPDLTTKFVFDRFEGSLPFPSEIRGLIESELEL